MSQEYHASDNFYTFQELKDFTANFTDLTLANITKFVETKTKSEYTVVKRKLVVDLNKRLFQNTIAIFDIQRFLNEQWTKTKDDEHTKGLTKDIQRFLTVTWAKVTEDNRLVGYRWADELKDFEQV